MTTPGIVAKPEDVTSTYLTQVLNHAGISATIESFTQGNVGTGQVGQNVRFEMTYACLLYTSPSPRDATLSRMPSSA